MKRAKKTTDPEKPKRVTVKAVQDTESKPYSPPSLTFKPDIDEDGWSDEGLTAREEAFVEFLIGKAGGNSSKAAELAGYASENRNSLMVSASRVLSRAKVREAIARRLAKANLNGEWVRQMTAALAASNMGSFLKLGDDGKPVIDWRQAQDMGAFIQIRKYKERGFSTGDSVEIIERSIETHNPAPYLSLLAKMLGMISDQPATSVTVNVNQMSDDDLVRIATRGGVGSASQASGTLVAD